MEYACQNCGALGPRGEACRKCHDDNYVYTREVVIGDSKLTEVKPDGVPPVAPPVAERISGFVRNDPMTELAKAKQQVADAQRIQERRQNREEDQQAAREVERREKERERQDMLQLLARFRRFLQGHGSPGLVEVKVGFHLEHPTNWLGQPKRGAPAVYKPDVRRGWPISTDQIDSGGEGYTGFHQLVLLADDGSLVMTERLRDARGNIGLREPLSQQETGGGSAGNEYILGYNRTRGHYGNLIEGPPELRKWPENSIMTVIAQLLQEHRLDWDGR